MPTRLALSLLAALLALVALPAGARAATLEPLIDLPPTTPLGDRDRVITGDPGAAPKARAAATQARAYKTADGSTVRVSLSDSYGEQSSLAQSYVDFLGSLEHGSELSRLRVHIATPSEVESLCGGVEGTLACYEANSEIMVVPGRQIAAAGVTTSYVVAHEYGHHIARNRSNAPFEALDYGPKHWASYERVCAGVLSNQLAPGDEGANYRLNPGESWAEVYAQLRYPDVPWQFAERLKPDAGAFAAARKDVSTPWRVRRTKTFSGRFVAGGSNIKLFTFDLTLDGALDLRLDGPSGAQYALAVKSDGKQQAKTTRRGADESLRFSSACRTQPSERVQVVVTRTAGSGPFSVSVKYAG